MTDRFVRIDWQCGVISQWPSPGAEDYGRLAAEHRSRCESCTTAPQPATGAIYA